MLAFSVASEATAVSFSDDEIEFFEKNIRPILVDRCFKCHGPEESESGLRVDSRESLITGGDQGPAVVPEEPDESILLEALSYDLDDLQMPPDGKLEEDEIGAFREWIEAGAAWPEPESTPSQDKPVQSETTVEQRHWSFESIAQPEIPGSANDSQRSDAIDRFIAAKQRPVKLSASPAADRSTLVRRAYYDLHGLPPRYEDVVKEVETQDPDWYEAMIDRLLDDPRYGERWARHWLDVARYADTRGYVDGGQAEFPFAYTYRDYVIRAFNEDLPFDEFILDQLIADLRNFSGGDRWRLAAMGFLTTGRQFNFNTYDILDDQIDVIGRGLMGLTISCARCHDHKYDQITIADYYSLYGILASSFTPTHADLPLLEPAPETDDFREYLEALKDKKRLHEEKSQKLFRAVQHEMRAFAGDYLVYLVQENPMHRAGPQNPLKTERTILRGPSAYGFGAIRRWRNYIRSRPSDDPVFGLWQSMFKVAKDQFPKALGDYLDDSKRSASLNSVLRKTILQRSPTSMIELARCYGVALESIYHETKERKGPLAARDKEQLRQVLYGRQSPVTMREYEAIDCFQLDEHVQFRNSIGEIEKISVNRENIPGRPMLMVDRVKPVDPIVFLRGQPNRPGKAVERRIPSLLSDIARLSIPAHESGRVELAKVIVHPNNPLTARVIVNRVWQWHFGQPLVKTPSDFGARCDPPLHRELLDFLASSLIKNAWSLKWLHREIMLSQTYQQASVQRDSTVALDPANEYFWRFPPRRLDWESIRDSLLSVSRRLDTKRGGPAIRLAPDDPRSTCRTVFLRIDRQVISKAARNFDFPSPDFTTAARSSTIVPQQTLFFLNSPFVLMQARELGADAEKIGVTEKERVEYLFRRILARQPTPNEVTSSLRFLPKLPRQDGPITSGWQYGYGELSERTDRVTFHRLPFTDAHARQGGADWPDPKLHYLRLTATGGHVGIDRQHAVIRRWTSPIAGKVSVSGDVVHVPDEENCGDGIRAIIVHARHGILGDFSLNDDRTTVKLRDVTVTAGDTIDFIAECQKNHFCDLFEWAPTIVSHDKPKPFEWSATADFAMDIQVPMTRWARFAHALLQLNEFTQLK